MIFRQLFHRETCTYTYLLGDETTHEAVLVDPVQDTVPRDVQLLQELGLTLTHTLETHVHADHITGSGLLRQQLGSHAAVSRHGGAPCADVLLDDGDVIRFGAHRLEARYTPGHTAGCVTYVLDDGAMALTGDTLLIRGCGRTDFQQGDSAALYRSVHERIFSLPAGCVVYPGHDYRGHTSSTIGEERRFNPRLGAGRDEAEFVAIMAHLDLDLPRHIHEAVPANLECGMTESVGDAVNDVTPPAS